MSIVKNPNGTVTVNLQRPARTTANGRHAEGTPGETVSAITFRPASFGDLKAMGQSGAENDIERGYWMVHRLSNVSEDVLDQVEGEDMKNCLVAVKGFLPTSRQT